MGVVANTTPCMPPEREGTVCLSYRIQGVKVVTGGLEIRGLEFNLSLQLAVAQLL
jgi:hypothetical protein